MSATLHSGKSFIPSSFSSSRAVHRSYVTSRPQPAPSHTLEAGVSSNPSASKEVLQLFHRLKETAAALTDTIEKASGDISGDVRRLKEIVMFDMTKVDIPFVGKRYTASRKSFSKYDINLRTFRFTIYLLIPVGGKQKVYPFGTSEVDFAALEGKLCVVGETSYTLYQEGKTVYAEMNLPENTSIVEGTISF